MTPLTTDADATCYFILYATSAGYQYIYIYYLLHSYYTYYNYMLCTRVYEYLGLGCLWLVASCGLWIDLAFPAMT